MSIQVTIAEWIAKSKPAFVFFMAVIGWPLLSAWLNSASRIKDIEVWEAWALRNPKLAGFVERLRVWGVDPKKLLDISRREAARRAGQIPPESMMKMYLPPSVATVLADEAKRKQLVDFIVSLSQSPEESTAPAGTPPSEAAPPAAP